MVEEIVQQFGLWVVLVDLFDCCQIDIDVFFGECLGYVDQWVIFIGVGSLGFIVEMVVDQFNVQWLVEICVIYIISLFIYLVLYLCCDCLILLVLFGCSGFSLESVVVVDLVCGQVDEVCFLDIICNVDGELVWCGQGCSDILLLLMLLVSCDCVFVMISSLICMLLVVFSVFDCVLWLQWLQCLQQLFVYGGQVLYVWDVVVGVLVQVLYICVIYFGSGLLEVIVCEVVLKVFEFIVGCVLVLVNILLGFCYGFKFIFNVDMLVVMLCSVQLLLCCYEQDLLNELCCDGIVGWVILIGLDGDDCVEGDFVFDVVDLFDLWLVFLWLLVLQCYVL